MNRINLPDGSMGKSRSLQAIRVVAYLLISVGGVFLVISDLLVPTYGLLAEVMAWFLAVGGLFAALGAITERWVGEFTGLPLAAAAFVVLSFYIYNSGKDEVPWIAAANLCLLAAFAALLMARWRVVLAIFRVADYHALKNQVHT